MRKKSFSTKVMSNERMLLQFDLAHDSAPAPAHTNKSGVTLKIREILYDKGSKLTVYLNLLTVTLKMG